MCNVTLDIFNDMLGLYFSVGRKNWTNILLAALKESSILFFQNAYVFPDRHGVYIRPLYCARKCLASFQENLAAW